MYDYRIKKQLTFFGVGDESDDEDDDDEDVRDEHVAQVGLVLRQDRTTAVLARGVVLRPRQDPLDERRRLRIS